MCGNFEHHAKPFYLAAHIGKKNEIISKVLSHFRLSNQRIKMQVKTYLQIPILPSQLLDILEAPTPYIIGVHDNDKYLEYSFFDEIEDVSFPL